MNDKRLTNGSLALNNKKVITIDAVKTLEEAKLRVAAYARVSSDSTDQLNSFVAQTTHYISLISSNENWTLVDIYADEGITGTSADKRTEFQRLLSDCRKGLVDRVLVKSISRFARNTKDIEKIIADLQVNPTLICNSQTESENQKRITQLEQELQEAMEKENFDDVKARRIVLELAQARLESCGAGEYETQRIRHYISALGINELEQLVPQIATAILIPVTGDIELLLKNGQTVRRSGSSCR